MRARLCRSLQLLCHCANLALKGIILPGEVAGGNLPQQQSQQQQLARALHKPLAAALPELSPPQLGAALWSYATLGVGAQDWTDDLMHQVGVGAGSGGGRGRLQSA